MTEINAEYKVNGKQSINPDDVRVKNAVQHLTETCKQFDRMTEEEKFICIENVRRECNREFMGFYNTLKGYVGDDCF